MSSGENWHKIEELAFVHRETVNACNQRGSYKNKVTQGEILLTCLKNMHKEYRKQQNVSSGYPLVIKLEVIFFLAIFWHFSIF